MTETKRKLSAKQFVADISAGMTDRELATKYELKAFQLQSVFQKLAKAGLLAGTRLEGQAASAKTDPVPAPQSLRPQTNGLQPRTPPQRSISTSAEAESFVLTAGSGLKGEWRAILSDDSLNLESVDGKHSAQILRPEADDKLQLWESSLFPPFLVLLNPKRTTFKLDPDLLRRFKVWFGPPTRARLRQALKPRFSFCIAIGILYLVTAMPISGDSEAGIDPLPFDPIGAFFGLSLLILALLAKFRPSRTLLLLDAVWFLLLAANLLVGILRGDSPWWLILGALLIWAAFGAFRDFQRLKPDHSDWSDCDVPKPIVPA